MFAFSSVREDEDLISISQHETKKCEIDIELGECNVVTTNNRTYTKYSFRFRAGPYVHVFSERYSKLREFNEALLKAKLYQDVFGDNAPKFPKKRWMFDHTKPKQYNKRANELLQWFKLIISYEEIVRYSLFQNRIRLPKILKVALWTNIEVLDWAESLSLGKNWNDIMMKSIEENACIGVDLIQINKANDVAKLFNFNNTMLKKRIFREIKKIKGDTEEIEIIKKNSIFQEPELDDFRVNIIAQDKQFKLSQKVTKNTKISYIKQLYKYESGIKAAVNEFHFYAKLKLLPIHNTLEECGIVDDRHLITVKFEIKGADTSKWKKCVYCRKAQSSMVKCSGCKIVEYCNENCATLDWNKHKYKCTWNINKNKNSNNNRNNNRNYNRNNNNIQPICICGDYLQKRLIQSVYGGTGVVCDHCFQSITDTSDEFLYHCPQGKNRAHANGYDLCLSCSG